MNPTLAPQKEEKKGEITPPYPKLGIRWAILAVLALGLVVAFGMSLALGSVAIPPGDVVTILFGGTPSRATWTDIIFKFRLPKAVTAILAGAGLAVGGLQMQTLFRNPLADPFVLGISSGASFGVAIVVLGGSLVGTGSVFLAGLVGVSNFSLVIAASLGAGLVLVLVLLVAQRVQSGVTLLVLGLMFGYITQSIVSILLYLSQTERIQAYINWTFGSFGGITWTQMQAFAPTILTGLTVAVFLPKPLNALLLGDDYARSMGVNVRRSRFMIIGSTALLAGAVTAFCGPVSFLGLAVPHLCRGIFKTSDHRVLIPATILLGAIVALVADIVAQLPGSGSVLPVNAVTALLGAPVVIWVILRRKSAIKI
jgi:iron complex transport system permease protein